MAVIAETTDNSSVSNSGSGSPPEVLEESKVTGSNSGASNSINEEMMMEMYQYDPIEGPSWLLDTRARRRGPIARLQKTTEVARPPSSTVDSATLQEDVVSQSTNNLNVADESAAAMASASSAIPETETSANLTANSISSESRDRISEPVDRESGRPSKRRAAAAVASFKEPSLNKKLRQGDDLNRDAKFRVGRKTKSTGAKK